MQLVFNFYRYGINASINEKNYFVDFISCKIQKYPQYVGKNNTFQVTFGNNMGFGYLEGFYWFGPSTKFEPVTSEEIK